LVETLAKGFNGPLGFRINMVSLIWWDLETPGLYRLEQPLQEAAKGPLGSICIPMQSLKLTQCKKG